METLPDSQGTSRALAGGGEGGEHREEDGQEGADFLSLPAFRMMCLSNPLLDAFFSSQLPASFTLEAPHRASVNGTSIWHDVQPSSLSPSSSSSTAALASNSATRSPRSSQSPVSAPASTTSFASPVSGRTYSKDVSTGVVGRLGGFLNNFLGEDVKSKVDDLADSLGEKLHTKVVRGPLPSFVNTDLHGSSTGGSADCSRRKKSSGTMGMDDLRAMEEERREKRRMRELEEREEEGAAAAAARATAVPASASLRGIDVAAAQESLRMATEAVMEGTQTSGKQFGDDIPVSTGPEDDEEEEVGAVDDLVNLSAKP